LRTLGFEASAGGPDALRARIARELPMWGDIIKQAAIKPPQSRLGQRFRGSNHNQAASASL
jgi:hypothetical protein